MGRNLDDVLISGEVLDRAADRATRVIRLLLFGKFAYVLDYSIIVGIIVENWRAWN